MNSTLLLNGVTGDGSGTALELPLQPEGNFDELGRSGYPIQIYGIGTATVTMEGSFNGTDFSPMGDGVFTVDRCVDLLIPFPFVRATVSGYSSGTITVTIGH